MKHAAESQHWYTPDGSPAYEVMSAKGTMRPTTLRDAKKLGLFPGVSSITKCAAAPILERWKQEQVLMAALTLPRGITESEQDWLRRVMIDSQTQARQAAERGTMIHAVIQEYFECGLTEGIPPETLPFVRAASGAIKDYFPSCDEEMFVTEESFADPLGFGGKVDLHDEHVVIDFKTKEFGPDDSLKTWDEHHMQIAAYRYGLGMYNARGAICYVSVSHPGLARLIEIPEDDLKRGWECFSALFNYWKAKNRYDPSKAMVPA